MMTSRIANRLAPIAFLVLLLPVAARAERAVIRIPGETWAIAFESPALLGGQESTRDGNFAFRANSGLFNLSLFVELPQGKGETHTDCYQHDWPMASRNPLIDAASIQVKETAGYVRVQYDVAAEMSGKKVRQRHVNYYIARQGKWIDVHISYVEPGEKDAGLFETFDKTLACGPTDALPPADRLLNLDPAETAARVMKYVADGTRLFRQQDYMACAFAEMGKRDEAIASLRRAFEFRENMLPGETLPDPATDDSFARFMKDKPFADALKEMRGK